jgi:hypothetical protein
MKKQKLKYNSLVIAFFVIILIVALPALYFAKKYLDGGSQKINPSEAVVAPAEVTKVVKPTVAAPPASYNLTVPYTVQAPGANWKVHEESCEEAALLMYQKYLAGSRVDIAAPDADAELRAMKAWQVKNWGAEGDISMQKIGELAQLYYGRSFRLIPNITEEQIKKEVAAGRPVMVPVMTQSLKNSHYSPGNVYHILLIKGYDATGVITNDPGVKEGKDWHYDWAILWSAVDAQNSKMGQGRTGLVLEP